jgi:hypothetical protein
LPAIKEPSRLPGAALVPVAITSSVRISVKLGGGGSRITFGEYAVTHLLCAESQARIDKLFGATVVGLTL